MSPSDLLQPSSDIAVNLPPFVDVLKARGAFERCHSGNRTLGVHLVGTWTILRRWGQPEHLCVAGLFHSAYATEYFQQPLFLISNRANLQKLIGRDSEAVVFSFCTISRKDLRHQLSAYDSIPERGLNVLNFRTNQSEHLSKSAITNIITVEMANIAEQIADDGTVPGYWMTEVSQLGSLIRTTCNPTPPIFNFCTQKLNSKSEMRARTLYLEGIAASDHDLALAKRKFELASVNNPWLAEPHILLSLIALDECSYQDSWNQAAAGIKLLDQWGTSWDKNRTWDHWYQVANQVCDLAEKASLCKTCGPPAI